MAHRSKKKHLKHLHKHEAATAAPAAKKHAGAKAEIEADRVARPRTASAKAGSKLGKVGAKLGAKKAAPKKAGIVRSLAKAATRKIAAKPKKIIKRAASRVKSIFGAE
jgi:hypothetical protein